MLLHTLATAPSAEVPAVVWAVGLVVFGLIWANGIRLRRKGK